MENLVLLQITVYFCLYIHIFLDICHTFITQNIHGSVNIFELNIIGNCHLREFKKTHHG